MKRLLILFLLLSVRPLVYATGDDTRLLVGITVSNFYPEWLQIYRHELAPGGLRRLIDQGRTVQADYGYLYSQTGVDHVSIYTGVTPSTHGIVAHAWYDRLKERRVSAVENPAYCLVGAQGTGLSPEAMRAPALGTVMKGHNVFSKVYSLGVNGEETVLSGGSCPDLALWLDDKTGRWISSSYYGERLPSWVEAFNGRLKTDSLIRRGWVPLEAENSRGMKMKSRLGLVDGFYYDLAQARRKYATCRILKATPYANTLVVDLAEELLKSGEAGTDSNADLLCLNLGSLDYMNRDFDVHSREFKDLVLRLDRDVERLFRVLDQKVGKGYYTVFLTFAEPREMLPEEWSRFRIPSDYFSPFKAVALMKSFLNLLYGEGEWIADYDAMQVYLDRAMFDKKKIDIREVQDKITNFLAEFEGVASVLPAHALTDYGSAAALVRRSFSQQRSGDVLFSLQPAWIPLLKEREDYFARYSKRHKVPFYLYGRGQQRASLAPECPMKDVLPALCRLVGVPVPYTADL